MEIVVGLLIGIAIGATGVGGGTLTAPTLILLMHYPPRQAVATALVYASAVKLWASAVYLYKKQVNFRILAFLLAGGIPGAILGSFALTRLKVTHANAWIMFVVGLVVTFSAVMGVWKPGRTARKGDARKSLLSILAFPIGLESSFSSSGTGALGTVLLFRLTSLIPPAVVGTDLAFGLVVCAIGGTLQVVSGNGNWHALEMLVPAGIVGSIIGILLGNRLPTKALRITILVCAATIGITLLFNGVQGIR
jgi:uncharacterized membrane protein YfcA